MSQEYNSTPTKRPKHTARANRNKPVLVTSAETTSENAAVSEATDLAVQEVTPIESGATVLSTPAASTDAPKRRLPNFFSTVGKNATQETGSKAEIDPAQARLARAARSNRAVTQNAKSSTKESSGTEIVEKPRETPKPATKPAVPVRSKGGFKTRHIIGIGIYLLAANFVGLFETQFLHSIGADVKLTEFNLFGGHITITSSTLLFLATLVIILLLLAKFDFIPRSLGAAPASRNTKTTTSTRNTESVRTPQPSVRQGIKGADDRLYNEYRQSQRREKKR